MFRVDLSELFGNLLAHRLRISQRQPNVFVGLGFMVVIMVIRVAVFLVRIVRMIVVMVMLFAFLVVVLGLLHAFDHFLKLYAVAQRVNEVDDLALRVGRARQRTLDPAVRLAADVDKQIALGDLDEIIRCGLVAVQIDTVVEQHGDLRPLALVAQNLACPVVLGENGRNDLELIALCGRLLARAASGEHARRDKQNHSGSNDFFHTSKTSKIMVKREKWV